MQELSIKDKMEELRNKQKEYFMQLEQDLKNQQIQTKQLIAQQIETTQNNKIFQAKSQSQIGIHPYQNNQKYEDFAEMAQQVSSLLKTSDNDQQDDFTYQNFDLQPNQEIKYSPQKSSLNKERKNKSERRARKMQLYASKIQQQIQIQKENSQSVSRQSDINDGGKIKFDDNNFNEENQFYTQRLPQTDIILSSRKKTITDFQSNKKSVLNSGANQELSKSQAKTENYQQRKNTNIDKSKKSQQKDIEIDMLSDLLNNDIKNVFKDEEEKQDKKQQKKKKQFSKQKKVPKSDFAEEDFKPLFDDKYTDLKILNENIKQQEISNQKYIDQKDTSTKEMASNIPQQTVEKVNKSAISKQMIDNPIQQLSNKKDPDFLMMLKMQENKFNELKHENERLKHFLPDSYTEMRLREKQLQERLSRYEQTIIDYENEKKFFLETIKQKDEDIMFIKSKYEETNQLWHQENQEKIKLEAVIEQQYKESMDLDSQRRKAVEDKNFYNSKNKNLRFEIEELIKENKKLTLEKNTSAQRQQNLRTVNKQLEKKIDQLNFPVKKNPIYLEMVEQSEKYQKWAKELEEKLTFTVDKFEEQNNRFMQCGKELANLQEKYLIQENFINELKQKLKQSQNEILSFKKQSSQKLIENQQFDKQILHKTITSPQISEPQIIKRDQSSKAVTYRSNGSRISDNKSKISKMQFDQPAHSFKNINQVQINLQK